ncbi:CCC motif membrane protein [Flavobacterium aurantiibacter]|uniref:CCC motif membrane protein n=1 Tax=Flavobacterium aurantiibacter TaxID=2023067 RepID=UPI0021D39CFD|nr:CCC motif membrane protein [Flavobacterium aurantiibacter]
MPGCCFYCVGLIFAIIALVLAKKDKALFAANPEGYDNYSTLKTGRVLAIIGLILNILALLSIIFVIATFGWAVMNDPAALQQAMQGM